MKVGLVVVCLAAVVAAGEQETAIREVIADIRRAEKERDPDAALDHVDVEAFRKRVAVAGLALKPAAAEAAARRLFALDRLGGFSNARIRKIKIGADGRTAFCVMDHRAEWINGRLRWWLMRTPDGWRLYDADVMDISLSLSESLVLGARSTRAGHARLLNVIQKVRALFENEEFDELLELTAGIDEADLPPWGGRALRAIRASALVAAGDAKQALQLADGLVAADPPTVLGHLVRAMALNELERYDDALAAARAYTDAVGPSAEAAFATAVAYLRKERKAEAVAACKAALVDDPDDANLVYALALALPDDGKSEIVGYLRGLGDLEETLPEIVRMVAVDDEDWKAVAALAAAAEKLAEGGAVAAYARGHAHYGDEKYEAAAASFKLAFKRAGESWHLHYVLWYLDAMAEDGKVIKGLDTAPDRGVAFRYLAAHVAGAERADDLAKLVAARAPDKEKAPVFHVWDAQARFDGADYEGALALLARHAKILEDVSTDHSWRVDEIRVKALVRLGRLVEADAASQDVDKLLRLVFVLATGDLAAATAAFKEALDDDWSLAEIWDDEDVARFLKTDKMKPLREKHPQPKEDDK